MRSIVPNLSLWTNTLKVVPQESIRNKGEQDHQPRVLLVPKGHIEHPKCSNGRHTKNQDERQHVNWAPRNSRGYDHPKCHCGHSKPEKHPKEQLHGSNLLPVPRRLCFAHRASYRCLSSN